MKRAPIGAAMLLGAVTLFFPRPAAIAASVQVQNTSNSQQTAIKIEAGYKPSRNSTQSTAPESDATGGIKPQEAGNSEAVQNHALPEANSDLPLVAILGFGSLAGSLAVFRTRR